MSSQTVSQNEIVRKNTAAIADMQRKVTEARTLAGRIADVITDFTGSMVFVYVHIVWFAVWILLNIGLIHIPRISEFDPFPFSLLTMIVSLEAIFLSTFVLISQNRLACASEKRAELDLQVNLLAEQKATKVLELLDQITEQLGQVGSRFNFKPDPEVKALKVSPEPQEVLQVIEETVKEGSKSSKETARAVEDITDEMEAVHDDVKHTKAKVDEVAEDVEKIKQEVKGMTSEQERLSLK
ncbi:MAG TPA: DUF1003 domain-containing protein [Pyrinomonadaceae bacterium]|nr:DUF1003 domain-containing protein [Pyrinomonadaceae bacterium]